MIVREDHPAILEGRTIFTKHIKKISKDSSILKSCKSNTKIGGGSKFITKGKWKGMPIYTLTLEERKTCPTSCHFWEKCYGNNMYLAHRFKNDALLYTKLKSEVKELAKKYPNGFVIRLHVLGDFFSVKYVELWKQLLLKYKNLNIFGYTARNDKDDINSALLDMISLYRDRCHIRFSSNKEFSLKKPYISYAAREDMFTGSGFKCPEQTGKVKSCINCAACWQTNKTVIFKTH